MIVTSTSIPLPPPSSKAASVITIFSTFVTFASRTAVVATEARVSLSFLM